MFQWKFFFFVFFFSFWKIAYFRGSDFTPIHGSNHLASEVNVLLPWKLFCADGSVFTSSMVAGVRGTGGSCGGLDIFLHFFREWG